MKVKRGKVKKKKNCRIEIGDGRRKKGKPEKVVENFFDANASRCYEHLNEFKKKKKKLLH